MRILTVVGNRPQFIKAAVVSGPLRRAHEELLVHTGQHHDANLSDVFFSELELPQPDVSLGIAGGSNSSQTARMLAALEPLLADRRPDATLVYGDTNSTLAGALASAQAQIPVIHVEAGMRSFDRSMPEELNRVLTDHAADLLLCPSKAAAENLRAEAVAGEVEVVGDVMVDLALRRAAQTSKGGALAGEDAHVLRNHGVTRGEYVLASAHRAGNVDDAVRLRALVDLLCSMPVPVVFPAHPRTAERLRQSGLDAELRGAALIRVVQPLGYGEFAALLAGAKAVLTDSGGVQKEAYIAGVPCVTLRANTEWVETVAAGWNTLVDLDGDAALAALEGPMPADRPPLYGDGDAAERCVEAISRWGRRARFGGDG